MIILLDAMGGDNAPDANIKGAVAAVNQVDAEIWLIGKEDVIKNKLKEFYNKTAKEIAVELYKQKLTNTDERNTTAPRLTELEKMGFVEATAKKTCKYTGKTVTVYKLTKLGFAAIKKM